MLADAQQNLSFPHNTAQSLLNLLYASNSKRKVSNCVKVDCSSKKLTCMNLFCDFFCTITKFNVKNILLAIQFNSDAGLFVHFFLVTFTPVMMLSVLVFCFDQ